MNDAKKRGGWSNSASADNGRKATQQGRPAVKATFRKGDILIVERQPLAPGPDNPIPAPEVGTVLSANADELEIQIGDSILVVRRPDAGEVIETEWNGETL